MLFRLHFLLHCICFYTINFYSLSYISFYVACAFVICLIKYLLTYLLTYLRRHAKPLTQVIVLLWTQRRPDIQEKSVCRTHTPAAAVHLNDGRALVLTCSCLRWDCQTSGKSAAPSQICSHHPVAQRHCHDSLAMLWTRLASCLQLQNRRLPQPAECQVQVSQWDINVYWITSG